MTQRGRPNNQRGNLARRWCVRIMCVTIATTAGCGRTTPKSTPASTVNAGKSVSELFQETLIGDAVADFGADSSKFAEHGSWEWLGAKGVGPEGQELVPMLPWSGGDALVSRDAVGSATLSWPNVKKSGGFLATVSAQPTLPVFQMRWRSRVNGTVVLRGSYNNINLGKKPPHDPYEPYSIECGGIRFYVDGKETLHRQIQYAEYQGHGFEVVATVKPESVIDILVTQTDNAPSNSTQWVAKVFDRKPIRHRVTPYDPAKQTDFEKLTKVTSVRVSPARGIAVYSRRYLKSKEVTENGTRYVDGHETCVWDLRSDKKLFDLNDEEGLNNHVLSADGRYLAAKGTSFEHRVWDLQTGEVVAQFNRGKTFLASTNVFSPDSKHLLSPTENGYYLFELATGKTQVVGGEDNQTGVFSAAFSPTKPLLYVIFGRLGLRECEIRALNLETQKWEAGKISVPISLNEHLEVSSDGSRIVGVGKRGRILVIDISQDGVGRVIHDWARPSEQVATKIDHIALTSDGIWLSMRPSYTGKPPLEVCHLPTGAVRAIGPAYNLAHDLYDDRTALLIRSDDGSPGYYDLASGEQVNRPPLPLLAAKPKGSPTAPGNEIAENQTPPSNPTAPGNETSVPATSLTEQAVALRAKGDYGEAANILNRAMKAKGAGNSSAQSLKQLRLLADTYRRAGEFTAAEETYKRCRDTTESQLTRESVDFAFDLRDVAETTLMRGDVERAIHELKAAVQSRLDRFGAEHPAVADGHIQLGDLYLLLDQVDAASEHFQTSVAVGRTCSPPSPATLGEGLRKAASTFLTLEDYDQALSFGEEAATVESSLSASPMATPRIADTLRRLSIIYAAAGRPDSARKAALGALEVMEKCGSPVCRERVALQRMRADSYSYYGKANEAEVQYRQLLDLANQVYGENHYKIGLIYSAMGQNYLVANLGRYAVKYQTKAIESFVRLFGEEYPNRAGHINLFAAACMADGRLEEAEKHFRESREIAAAEAQGDKPLRQTLFGDVHLRINATMNLGELYFGTRRQELARQEFNRVMKLIHGAIRDGLPLISDRQRLRYVNEMTSSLGQPLAQAFLSRKDQAWIDDSAEWALNMKGLVSDVMAKESLLLREAETPELSQAARQLRQIRESIAAHSHWELRGEHSEEEVKALRQRESQLSNQLRAAFKDKLRADEWASLSEIRAKLDPRSVLIEVKRLRYYDIAQKRFRGSLYRWKGMRYVAWVIPPQGAGNVQLHDLGLAQDMDIAIRRYLAALNQTTGVAAFGTPEAIKLLGTVTDELSSALIGKLEPSIGAYDRWLICPDSLLWLTPWHGLKGKSGKHLVESKDITCLTTSRALLLNPTKMKVTRPVIVANPDFNAGAERAPLIERFSPLPGTAKEAEAVAPSLKKYAGEAPQLLVEEHAIEAAVKGMTRPQVLLLSTHGFFEAFPRRQSAQLRCGLALAGANRSLRWETTSNTTAEEFIDANDGILTGLEVTNIDLRSTELVVLSACESGLGDVSSGEGVAGLRQSFEQAGARGVVATLWSVNDETTAKIMSTFFKRLSEGQPPSRALRIAQLSLKNELTEARGEDYAHPMFWAPFVLSGLPDP